MTLYRIWPALHIDYSAKTHLFYLEPCQRRPPPPNPRRGASYTASGPSLRIFCRFLLHRQFREASCRRERPFPSGSLARNISSTAASPAPSAVVSRRTVGTLLQSRMKINEPGFSQSIGRVRRCGWSTNEGSLRISAQFLLHKPMSSTSTVTVTPQSMGVRFRTVVASWLSA